MPTLLQRLAFLTHVGPRYTWQLVRKRLGMKQARRVHHGVSFVVPLQSPGGVQLMREGEAWMVPLLRLLLPLMPGVFVDVGANVGATLLQLRAADPDRPWLGFEPSPDNCRTLHSLIAANKLTHTTLVEAGASDHNGSGELHGVSGTDGSASLFANYHAPGHPAQKHVVSVKLVDPASMAESELAQSIGVIKIDVEGYELEVIRGFTPLIQRDRPVILCEILPVVDDSSPRARTQLGRQEKLMQELQALQYRFVHIAENGDRSDVTAPRNDVSVHAGNYLLLPAERYDELRPLV